MTESKHLHFIGIGGSSMSGLAHLMREQGCTVSGSDSTASHKTEHLMDEGIEVFIGHAPENVRGADLVVYSAAIPPENPERQEAERLGIPQISKTDIWNNAWVDALSNILFSGADVDKELAGFESFLIKADLKSK